MVSSANTIIFAKLQAWVFLLVDLVFNSDLIIYSILEIK